MWGKSVELFGGVRVKPDFIFEVSGVVYGILQIMGSGTNSSPERGLY